MQNHEKKQEEENGSGHACTSVVKEYARFPPVIMFQFHDESTVAIIYDVYPLLTNAYEWVGGPPPYADKGKEVTYTQVRRGI